jgi:aminoglycoside phosphotransferase (APT) family kinase protein
LTSPDDPTPVRIDELIGVASSVATVPIHGLRPKSSPRRRLRRAVRTLAAVTPHLDRRLQRLSEGIESALDGSRRTDAAVHGDLYEGQVLVDPRGSITAVLDTDGLGIGDPVTDAANVAAHLGALTETHPHLSLRLGRVREAAIAAIADTFDTAPAMVAAREAIAGLQLAAGPLRVMDPNWIERTERRIEWVEHAFGLRDGHRQRVL